MASRKVTIVTDDLDGTEGASTREFAIGGQAYLIDLVDANYDKMVKQMSRYVQFARKKPGAPRTRRVVARKLDGKKTSLADIREWARKNGFENVPNRGRVRDEILDAHAAAHAKVK